jgi:hypothetical protein
MARAAEQYRKTSIANFDSIEQLYQWKRILNEINKDQSLESAKNQIQSQGLWSVQGTQDYCGQFLHAYPQFATYFAGIIRTACLYSSRIVLTAAEVFDGIFFLALGPKAVNGILGISYKDGPKLEISGNGKTVEESFRHFFVSKQGASNCWRLNKKTYSVLDRTVIYPQKNFCDSSSESSPPENGLKVDDKMCDAAGFFEQHLNNFNATNLVDAVTGQFTQLLYSQNGPVYSSASGNHNNNDHSIDYLGRCWKEWIDAVSRGEVVYTPQKESLSRQKFRNTCSEVWKETKDFFDMDEKAQLPESEDYDTIASAQAGETGVESSDTNQSKLHSRNGELPDIESLQDRAIRAVRFIISSGMHRRTEAFEYFNKRFGDLPDDPEKLMEKKLTDWYQYVYKKSLAEHVGASLIYVSEGQSGDQKTQNSSITTSDYSFIDELAKSSSSPVHTLSGKVTQLLGQMPHVKYALLCFDARKAIESWREQRQSLSDQETTQNNSRKKEHILQKLKNHKQKVHQRWATRNISYCVQRSSESNDLFSGARSLLIGTIIAVFISLLSALLDNVWLSNTFPIWMIVLLSWLASILPNVIEVCTWLWEVHSSSETVVID